MVFNNDNTGSRRDLDDLMVVSRRYAEYMMKTTGGVPPTFMAVTPEGLVMFVPSSVDEEGGKDKFASAGRLLAVGYRASAVALILESWATFAKRPGLPLPKGPPSQSPERREVVVVMGETHGTCAQQFMFIERNSSGKFTGFGESLLPQFEQMEGRFAQMMPPKAPTETDVLAARMRLTAMGVKVANQGHNPMWN